MKFYYANEFKESHSWWIRTIEILPSLTLLVYTNYEIEGVKLSWLGFTIGVSKSKKK